MTNGNKNKSDFLGMSFSTANHWLRKSIIYKYVVKNGDDICFRCGDRITKIEDLSIEHMEDWLNISVDLFWDLDNIAFSHLKCNINAHNRRNDNNHNRLKTHCSNGHEFNDKNTYLQRRGKYKRRNCRVCLRERMRKLRLVKLI